MSQDTAARAKIRLLHCKDCRTIDVIPDFDGPPEYDTLLEIALSKHETGGYRHIGKLYDVEERVWKLENMRRALIEQIKGGGSSGLATFDSSFYDVRDQFAEDAMSCYQAHLSPKGACPDWKSDRKMLLPDTKAERKEVGLDAPRKGTAPVQYLCQHCPVNAYMERKSRGD